jgi:hypothetical protein
MPINGLRLKIFQRKDSDAKFYRSGGLGKGVKYHAEDRFNDRRAVNPYVLGIDIFSIFGKCRLYFCAVDRRALGCDSFADRREV